MRVVRVVLLLFVATSSLFARELHWRNIDVKATLDREGTIHVRERQTIVFDGDWNGGERTFYVRRGQRLQVVGMRRETPEGEVALKESDALANIDDYRRLNDSLRWRSRLPSDPPFEKKELTYIIDYNLSNVLLAHGSGDERTYVLNHDFIFPDRSGVIEHLAVDLDFDREWQEQPVHRTANFLRPGESYVIERELRFHGEKAPESAEVASSGVRHTVIVIVSVLLPLLFLFMVINEVVRGFGREKEQIDRDWLDQHIFSELPEVVGYMYDLKAGPPEVAATLSRLEQEKKIATTVGKKRFLRPPVLEMKRFPNSGELKPHEKKLMNMFFVPGKQETDTDQIRKRYKDIGFNPGGELEPLLAGLAQRSDAWGKDVARPKLRDDFRTLMYGALLLVPGFFLGYFSAWAMIWIGVLGLIASGIGRGIASASAEKLSWRPVWWIGSLIPLAGVALLLVRMARREDSQIRAFPFIAAALFLFFAFWFVMKGGASNSPPERWALRRRIAAARRWFIQQLRSSQPEMKNDWMPYLLALGLGNNVDRWFSSFGKAAAAVGATSTLSSSSSFASGSSGSGESSIGGSWGSGGMASFGGAGATGSWAAAAGALGAGMAAPSSGGSGGGSGGSSGGGSSSGGGGGGGW